MNAWKRFGILATLFFLAITVVMGQEIPVQTLSREMGIQEYTGTLASASDEVRVQLQGLQAGDTIYALAKGATLFPFLTIYDASIRQRYAQNGATGEILVQYTVEQAGDYVLTLFSATGAGDYTLRVGINTPNISDGVALAPTTTPRPNTQVSGSVSRGTTSQTLTGTMNVGDKILVRVEVIRPDDTIYVAATGRGDFDPLITLTDETQTTIYAQDDNGGGGKVAVIQYVVTVETQMLLVLEAKTAGDYKLEIGVNTPVVLENIGLGGTAEEFTQLSIRRNESREFGGAFISNESIVLIDVMGLQAGDTIYVYAEGVDSVDPFVRIFSPDFQYILADDNNSGGGYSAALALTVDATGDYHVNLYANNGATGGYRLVVGVNDPTVLSNNAVQTYDTSVQRGFDCTEAPPVTRPELSGTVQTLESVNTIIHYTTQGDDATTQEYVLALRDALENSLAIQFNQLGWRTPPTDCDAGGDDRLDVYVMNITGGVIGYAQPENMVGDNPNTQDIEVYAAYSYLVIENDMDFTSSEFAIEYMQTTAAHEVHHNIQFGYDTNESFYGFYESGAVWIEALVYPELTDAYNYDDVFFYPDLCIGSRDSALRVYAEWVMLDSFSRDLGMTSYQQLWEFLSVSDGLEAFYAGLEQLGTTSEEVIQRMAIRNLLLDYARGDLFYSTVALENIIMGEGDLEGLYDGVQEQSVDYLYITAPDLYYFSVMRGGNIALTLVGVDTDTQTATVYELGKGGVVDTTLFDYAYLIVQNTSRHTNSESCNFTNWGLYVGKGDDLPLNESTGEVWDARYFRPPY